MDSEDQKPCSSGDGWKRFMKNMSASLITALLVFTLATAWIDLVQPRLDAIAQATTSKPTESTTISKKKSTSRKVAQDDEADDEAIEDPPAPKVATKSARHIKTIKDDASSSESTKERLRAQLADVKEQESRLVAREETLRMLYDDIRTELAAVEDIRRKSAAELAMAEKKVLEATVTKPGVAQSTESPAEATPYAKPKVSAEARIAGVIQDLASQGNVAAAASLLSGMKDREIAKVLTSLSTRDPRLALRLSDQVQAAKQEPVRR
jgi:hypothetical protein